MQFPFLAGHHRLSGSGTAKSLWRHHTPQAPNHCPTTRTELPTRRLAPLAARRIASRGCQQPLMALQVHVLLYPKPYLCAASRGSQQPHRRCKSTCFFDPKSYLRDASRGMPAAPHGAASPHASLPCTLPTRRHPQLPAAPHGPASPHDAS